jgi:membrane protease subunit HflK
LGTIQSLTTARPHLFEIRHIRDDEMNLPSRLHLPAALQAMQGRIRGMFNLNDPRWGRSDDKPTEAGKPEAGRPDSEPPPVQQPPQNSTGGGRGPGKGPNQGPPDLDELWRDFNRKLGGLFGGPKNAGRGGLGGGNNGAGGGGGGFQPDMKSAGIGAGLIAAVAVLIWLGTGFFIVQEGQQAVITQFGKYKSTWVPASTGACRIRFSAMNCICDADPLVDVGRDTSSKATGLRESAMLTEDENIVEIKFAVQYRLSDARALVV